MSSHICLTDRKFDPAQQLSEFLGAVGDAGGIVSFVGLARPSTRRGTEVLRLFLDHHPRLTTASLHEIADDATAHFDVSDVSIIHRFGLVLPGEPIVFVAAASAHRRAAFEAADYMMDRLKTDAFFWKREDAVDGSHWIEPTDMDRAERARWSEECRG